MAQRYTWAMAHLLLVEDDELLRDGLQAQLAKGGLQVSAAPDAESAQPLLDAQRFDAVVLDLGLPGMDGIALLQWIRQRFTALPVLILTARDDVDDRIRGLTAGADDYLTKPFNVAELQARLLALLRRARLPAFGGSLEVEDADENRLRLDPHKPLAWLNGEALEVTQREWSLLTLLVNNMGQVVSREDVLAVWQSDGAETASNALEVYVHRLRRKLSDSQLSIRNVRGLGYMLEHTDA